MKTFEIPKLRFSLLVLVGALACGLLATAAFGSVKVKDGAYVQAPKAKKPWGYIYTQKGKVAGAYLAAKFKNKSKKVCTPAGGTLDSNTGLTSISIGIKGKPVRPNSQNKFSFAARGNGAPGLKGHVSGQFKSTNKAALKFSINVKGCKSGTLKFNKALYTAGG